MLLTCGNPPAKSGDVATATPTATPTPISQISQSLQLLSTNSKAASATSPAPTDYRLQIPFDNTGTATAPTNQEGNASGMDTTSDLIMVGNDMYLVYNTLNNSNQSGIRFVKLTYTGGAFSTTATYWSKSVDVPVITAPVHTGGDAYKTYIRPAIAIYPAAGTAPAEVWVTCMQVNVPASSAGTQTYTYRAFKGTTAGVFNLTDPDAINANNAFLVGTSSPAGRDRAETRSIRPLACQGLLALLYTDARNITQFENARDSQGIPDGFANSAPVSFFLSVRNSDGQWVSSSDPVYSRSVRDDNKNKTAFVKQYDGDGAHFSAIATAFLDQNNLLSPGIHFVTNDGDKLAFYARYEIGEGLTRMHEFPPTYAAGYAMQAAYMHIAYDANAANPTLLATFSAKDKRPGLPNEAKALLTFTSNNGGSSWNDATPDSMIPFDTNKNTGEPRFEMPAIMRYPHVFLQQIDKVPSTPTMPNNSPEDFTFYSYSLPQPTAP